MKKKIVKKTPKKVAAKSKIPPFTVACIPAALAAAQIHRNAVHDAFLRHVDMRTKEAYDRCSVVVDSCMQAIRKLVEVKHQEVCRQISAMSSEQGRRLQAVSDAASKLASACSGPTIYGTSPFPR